MASSAKRLKLSLRKNNPQPDTTQNNESSARIQTSTSSSRDNVYQNQCTTTTETTVTSSLQNLREKLKESLPKLPNWRKFEGFPDAGGENLPSETNKDLSSEAESCQEECIASFSKASSTVDVQIKSGKEIPTKNLFIEQCPLCPLYFPHDWDQQEIQSHVSTHLDADDFD